MNELKIKDILNKTKDITLVAATKYVDEDTMEKLLEFGINNFGENRVDSFIRKHFVMRNLPIKWHFIGHLQRNKAKLVLNDIDVLHSLDSLDLAKMIENLRDRPLDCFIEVKMTSSNTKNGILPEELSSFLLEVKKYPKVNIIGLMTMTESDMDDSMKKEVFDNLVKLGHKYNFNNFSMGMSNDYEIAINSGSTYVRLGRVLFED